MGRRPFGHLMFGIAVDSDTLHDEDDGDMSLYTRFQGDYYSDELNGIEGIEVNEIGTDADNAYVIALESATLEAGYFTEKYIELPNNQLPEIDPARMQWFIQTLREQGVHDEPKWYLTYTYI